MKIKQTTDNKQLTNDKNVSGQMSVVKYRLKHAFTLIELIVVITIIAILVSAISISWSKAQLKSRDSRRKSDLKAIQQALDTYFETTNSFPGSTFDGKIRCLEQSFTAPSYYQDIPLAGIVWGTNFTCTRNPSHPLGSGGPDTFFQTFPKDPVYQSTSGYFYSVDASTGKSYTLSAKLENENDPDYLSGCESAAPNNNYCVKNQ